MDKKFIEKIEQAKKLLDECLLSVGVQEKTIQTKTIEKLAKKHSKTAGEDLRLPIETLVKNGFFDVAKVDLDVVSELQKKLLTKKKPLRASIVNVMRKMVRDGILERTEIIKGEKTLIAYKKS